MRSRSVEVLPSFGDDATGVVEAEDHALIQELIAPKRLLADKTLVADKLRFWLKTRPIKAVILSTASGAKPYPLGRTAYKRRNAIERLFCCLKNWRRIATRYDRLAEYYLAVIPPVSIVIAWIRMSPLPNVVPAAIALGKRLG